MTMAHLLRQIHRWPGQLGQDLRFAIRGLGSAPGFVSLAVLTMGLGIAANAVFFSVYNTVVLQALPVKEPHRFVAVGQSQRFAGVESSVSPYLAVVDALREMPDVFDWVAQYDPNLETVHVAADPQFTWVARVSANFFSVLDTRPDHGRSFVAGDDAPDGAPVALVSHDFWTKHLRSDDRLERAVLTIGGDSYHVVGVMPRSLTFPESHAAVWIPDRRSPLGTGHQVYGVYARLAAGITVEQARQRLATLSSSLEAAQPDQYPGVKLSIRPLRDQAVGPTGQILFVLLGAVGCVLLVSCANLANLQLVRNAGLQKTIAVRAALGAGRGRVVQLLLCESAIVSFLGGAVGLAAAVGGTRLVATLGPSSIPRLDLVAVDGSVVAVGLSVSVAAGCVAALLPAFRASRLDLMTVMHGSTLPRRPQTRASWPVLQEGFSIVQLSMALMLCVGAGLLIQSLWRLQNVELGFNPDNLLQIQVPDDALRERADGRRAILHEVAQTPGVVSAALTGGVLLLSGSGFISMPVRAESRTGRWSEPRPTSIQIVDSDYFGTLQTPVLLGRAFSEWDRDDAPCVVVINQAAAAAYWPSEDAVGRRADLTEEEPCEVVGVVANVREERLDAAAGPTIYRSEQQHGMSGPARLLVRSSPDLPSPANAVLARVKAATAMPHMVIVWPLQQTVQQATREPRFRAISLTAFAAGALLLAALGIFGVTAHGVAQRTREIGIRIALGAEAEDVLRTVLGRAALAIAIGVGAGLAGAAAVSRILSGMLFEVDPRDPVLFTGVALAFTMVALVASYVPARRATRVDPVQALRWE